LRRVATLASAIPSGGVESRLGSFLNLNAFTPGGNCVNNQNVVVPCQINGDPNPASRRRSDRKRRAQYVPRPIPTELDLSITKSTRITEATSVDFRAELFNAFNHPVFSGPHLAGFDQPPAI